MKTLLAGLGFVCGVCVLAGAVQQQDSQASLAQALGRIATAQERQAAAMERAVEHGSVALSGDLVIRMPQFPPDTGRSLLAEAKAGIVDIAAAVDRFAIVNGGRFPDSLQLLITPDENGQTFLGRQTVPRDPWGHEYHYEPPVPGAHHYRVVSFGSDGAAGGTGDAQDIDNLMIRGDGE